MRTQLSRGRCPRLAATAVLLLVFSTGGSSRAQEEEFGQTGEIIDLSPDNKAGWSMRNVLAPLTSLFRGGPSYWYEQRSIEIRTTPPGGVVDLFYIRSNFQKRFEQAETPVTVLLPPRIEAGPRDALTIRAFREGYRQKSVTLKASSREDQVVIELEPLPNTLAGISHRYFAGRGTLSFLTEELPEFRIQEGKGGFSVVLNETALSAEVSAALRGVRSPVVAELFAQQLGEDLVIQVSLTGRPVELRSRQGRDPARDLYDFSMDLVPKRGDGSVKRALDALGRLRTSHVTGCALRFDRALRERLDDGALARALTPHGLFTDKYLRAAMRRLGELVPGGSVRFGADSRFDPRQPIELEAALSRAGSAEGFLALLRQFVAELEENEFRRDTLRGLIAPELAAPRFDEVLDSSEAVERECRAAL